MPVRPLVIAHRGASAEAVENTLTAFRLAHERGADAVELDVHATADGVPVLLHDDTVDRTTDGSGDVRRLTLEQVREKLQGEVETLRSEIDYAQAEAQTTYGTIGVKVWMYRGEKV